MHKQGVTQDKFQFQYNKVCFDVIILIDREPFELLFGVIGYNYCFTLHLYRGYELEDLADEIFYNLCNILNLKPGRETFTSYKFLQYFEKKIPQKYSGRKVEPDEVAIYKKRKIIEEDKIYFIGWKLHNTDGRTVRNLEKTRQLLGEETYEFCKANNISSCWSSNPKDKKLYFSPQQYIKYKK